MRSKRAGFTLVEILAASTITGFIALVAVGALKALTDGSERLDYNIRTAAEIRYAANTLATDLINLYRDKNKQNMQFIGMTGASGGTGDSFLLFYSLSRTKARVGEPEGEIYEVEYYLQRKDEQSVLMRRLWPNPDKETTEPGGILTVIAEDVDVFQVRYFDGDVWSDEWPEEMESLPELIEVTIVAKQTRPGPSNIESFVVNLTRAAGSQTDSLEQTEQTESVQSGG